MYDDKPKMFACGANGGHLENDVIEIMKTIQYELKKTRLSSSSCWAYKR